MNGVVFVAGIYGVGKSTLCERISSLIHMPFYSAGDLISEQVGEIYGENKKVCNKDQNQNVLIECISQKIVKEQMFWQIYHHISDMFWGSKRTQSTGRIQFSKHVFI